MSYAFKNPDYVDQLIDSRWARTHLVNELANQLRTTDYSVIAERRTAHKAVNDFIAKMAEGSKVFTDTERFPTGRGVVFITLADEITSDLFVDLANNLSFRSSTESSDTAAVTNAPRGGDSKTDIQLKEETQKSTKQFAELSKKLASLPGNTLLTWNRAKFEMRTGATWTAGGGGGGGS